jgi:dipeptidyl aminopeptidase/acylaminoacyl peptidase
LELRYRIREKLPRAALAEMKAIRYKSSDGLEIRAYLALPKGVALRNFPTIILPHGGLGPVRSLLHQRIFTWRRF